MTTPLESVNSAPSGFFRRPIEALGDWALFSLHTVRGIFTSNIRPRVILPIFINIGVSSVGVVSITGVFIGMVLAVQAYGQFHPYGIDSAIGQISTRTILSELGPVLAAVMLAGRVGSSMAAELGTMKVTEQIDALACLGVDPVHYLSSPRFLACVLLIPLLTVLANVAGMLGSVFVCVNLYGIEPHHYWTQTLNMVGLWELFTGLFKAMIFGGILALISCHRGFHSKPGAQGVGQAATEAFVFSFIAILIVDFFMVYLFHQLEPYFAPLPAGTSF
jgi:phospholipid/cholesterol/gamma-HCH transport system permease protein